MLTGPKQAGSITNPLILTQHLDKVYGKGEASVRALSDVTVEIEKSRFTAIMGPSGSGKSTLLQCMAGLDQATSGSIVLDGIEITGMNERGLTRLRRDHIGFIFQSFNLVPTLNAKQNILLPSKIAGKKVNKSHMAEMVDAIGLSDRLHHLPSELSGGQQQRVACARALVTAPSVVFADEPTGNLDSIATAQVLKFLRQAVDRLGQTVVMVTHEAEAAAWADRVIFLADGKVAAELDEPNRNSVLNALRDLGDEPEPAPESTITLTPVSSLQEQLNEMAPHGPLSDDAALVVNQAQQILDELPGTILNDPGSEPRSAQ